MPADAPVTSAMPLLMFDPPSLIPNAGSLRAATGFVRNSVIWRDPDHAGDHRNAMKIILILNDLCAP
jgi:hypothetical protein